MTTEDYYRLVCTMNQVPSDADSAVLVVMKGQDIKVSTFGHAGPLTRLKKWMYKWLGGDL